MNRYPARHPTAPTLLQSLKQYDENRPGIPGEHWWTLAAGIAILVASRRSRSLVVSALGPLVGSALVYRAAKGRDGLTKVLRYLPLR